MANSLEIIRKPFIASFENITKTVLPQSQLDATIQERRDIDENDVIAQLFKYDSSETTGSLTNIFYLTAFLMGLNWLSSLFLCQFVNVTPPYSDRSIPDHSESVRLPNHQSQTRQVQPSPPCRSILRRPALAHY